MIKIRIHAADCGGDPDYDDPTDCDCDKTFREFADFAAVLAEGWTWEMCAGCSARDPTSDEIEDETAPDGWRPSNPVCTTYADGEIRDVYCTPECRDRDLERMRRRKAEKEEVEAAILRAWPDSNPHAFEGWFDTSGHDFEMCAVITVQIGDVQYVNVHVCKPLGSTDKPRVEAITGNWAGLRKGVPMPKLYSDEWESALQSALDAVRPEILKQFSAANGGA